MKNFILATLLLIALFITVTTKAQVGIGVSTANINSSAQLDVTSTTKGFLPPRMTEVQKIAISNPASGLLVYQTDGVSGYYYYDGAVWKSGLGPQGPAGPAGLSATSTMAEASTTGSSGTYLLNPSPNNIYINAGSWISIGANNTSSYYYVSGKSNENTITIVDAGFAVAWPVNATVALVGRIGAAGVAGPAGPLVTLMIAESGFLNPGSSGTFYIVPSNNNIYIPRGSYISINGNTNTAYFNVIDLNYQIGTIEIKNIGSATAAWSAYAPCALVGPMGIAGSQGPAGNDGLNANISIGAIGTATTNGATITSGVLSLAPADESHGGIVTASEQTFSGKKTFADSAIAKGFRATDSVTTNGFRATGTATANSFVKSGGTSSQYLMADGSTSAGLTATISAMQAQIAALQSQVFGLLNTVTIGSQIWTKQNLNVSTYRNGDSIPQVTDPTVWAGLTTGAWCYYNNDSANDAIYGKLYNWYAVNDPRGLAPVGYHISTDAEWSTSIDYLGQNPGGKMKESGTTHWENPNTGANNSSGFLGLPGGFRSTDGAFVDIGRGELWWSSTEDDSANASWTRNVNNYSGDIGRYAFNKIFGFSVRCIKD